MDGKRALRSKEIVSEQIKLEMELHNDAGKHKRGFLDPAWTERDKHHDQSTAIDAANRLDAWMENNFITEEELAKKAALPGRLVSRTQMFSAPWIIAEFERILGVDSSILAHFQEVCDQIIAMGKAKDSKKKCGMGAFLSLVEDEFNDEDTENNHGKAVVYQVKLFMQWLQ
ncbi:hypothetical protein OS493_028356 [Desmophyllum pertusum]|uniref:Uncharacterized protein n=1 Tax=Desmophyllum pertusum TaxID=174260 RepID=A0A9X0D7Q8_9CNID|nr:hypothetical protein OS493_028356 [Desmophyllum pertusum]